MPGTEQRHRAGIDGEFIQYSEYTEMVVLKNRSAFQRNPSLSDWLSAEQQSQHNRTDMHLSTYSVIMECRKCRRY